MKSVGIFEMLSGFQTSSMSMAKNKENTENKENKEKVWSKKLKKLMKQVKMSFLC